LANPNIPSLFIPAFQYSVVSISNLPVLIMERRNINRGFKKLHVWQDAISLYILACKSFLKFPYGLKRVAENAIDAAHSVSRNIAEGYCRRSLREYLNYLNIALGSCGEFHSCCESFKQAGQITEMQFEELDSLHYRVENALINLIKSLQKKQKEGEWEETF
jgi:four helix bundle protein